MKKVLKVIIKHKFDILISFLFIAIAGVLLLTFNNSKHKGQYVIVRQNDKIYGEYPLNENRTEEIKLFYGSNFLVIENGEAYITEASCPRHICVRRGKISNVGDMIICIPNQLFVTVIDKEVD